MKLSLILAALGAIPFTAADASHYHDDFLKYCGDGKTQGTLVAGDRTYSYHCNVGQKQEEGWSKVNVKSAQKCANVCSEMEEECNTPVWDEGYGQCWLGKKDGSNNKSTGRITMYVDDDASKLASCQADLKKWGPQEPICSKNDMKPVEANGKKFMLTCKHDIYGNKEQSGSFPEMKDCLKACADKSDCTYATHRAKDHKCWLGTVNPLDKKIEAKDSLNSAIVIR